jgi:two-component system sensor histidine kinase YesM
MKMKIRTKIIASTTLVVWISLLVSSLFTYHYVTEIIREQSIKDSLTKLEQISSQIKKMQEQIAKTAEYVITDGEINTLIVDKGGTNLEQAYFKKYNTQEKLLRFAALNTLVYSVLIVRSDGEFFSNFRGYEDYFQQYLKGSWFTKLMEKKTKNSFTPLHDIFYLGKTQQGMSYVVSYKNEADKAGPNYSLVLDIVYPEIKNVFSDSLHDFEQIQLLNNEGEILFSGPEQTTSDYSELIKASLSESNRAYIENKDYIVIVNSGMKEGWKQAAVISKAKLFQKINKIFIYYMIIILSSFIFTLVFILPIIFNITKPISRLTQAMKLVSAGNFNTSISIKSGDELEVLGYGFNRMVLELKEHMATSIQNEETKRNMQISLLMSQINPHFIYNTLNTVIYLSHADRNRDAEKITLALISILQDTIKPEDGDGCSTLSEEKNIIDKYMDIQQYRYPERFKLEWTMDDEIQDAIVPKMMIQPLVENALFHGICSTDVPGIILVQIRLMNGTLVITVEDNGIGMDEQTVEQIFIVPKTALRSDQTRGIGLRNIKERIHFLFGSNYNMEIQSQLGSGTRIVLRLPFKR